MRANRKRLLMVAAVAAGGLGALGWWGGRALRSDLGSTFDLHGVAYVGSTTCRRCHADEHASWHRTFHRTMTTEATPKNVRGDFSGATLVHAGVTTRMDRDPAGGFRMTFTRPGQPPRSVQVVRVVGSRRYQQYLAAEGNTLWRLPVAYHIEEGRWFPMTGAFLFADPSSDDRGDGADRAGVPRFGGGDFDRHVARWNDNCVFCHNVGPNPGRDPTTGTFDTEVAELGIACEACHGPGGEHARRNESGLRRRVLGWRGGRDPTIVNPSRLSPGRAADLCGRCHGQRITDDVAPFLAHGDPFVPGDDLALYSAPLWRDTALRGDRQAFAARFWADGTPRLTAYEYQGLLQSACAMRGPLTCTSCHGMHEGDPRGQLRSAFVGPGVAADRMCTQCHRALAVPAALAVHAHHDPAGEGARCVGCHMPRIVYGVLEIHRSHRIEIPAPGRALAVGRPDACTGCHVTATPGWAEAQVRRWYGGGENPAAGAETAGSPLDEVLAGEPLSRAVAADALGRAPPTPATSPDRGGVDDRSQRLAALLSVMLNDDFPAVRHLAWRSLRKLVAGPAATLAAEYDPSSDLPGRARVVEHLAATLGQGPVARPALASRARADTDLEIGE